VNKPTTLAFDDAGNLYFADAANMAVRGVWGIGSTTAPTATLATTTGGGQTVKIDAPFSALAVKLTDSSNTAIQGVDVRFKRKDSETGSGLGGSGLASLTTKTNVSGGAAMPGRVGLATGSYHFEASYSDIHGTPVTGSPQAFTVTAVAPDPGTIFPVVNFVHLSGTTGTAGPATFAKLNSYAWAVAAGSDGTIYVSDYCTVYKVTSSGEMSIFAGTPGGCAFAGDSGPAVGAKLYYPRGLALDETNGILYIADSGNQRIRQVSLATGVINTLAGGGSVSTAPFGDNGPATDANIGSVYSVSVGPDGKVYIPDNAHYNIRVVDPDTNIITSWVTATYPAACVNGVVSLRYADTHSAVRFTTGGAAYISGYICQGTTTSDTVGIALRAANGTMTRVAGLSSGITTENADAIATSLPDLSDFVLDGNGNLVLAMDSNHRVRSINLGTGKISTLAGDGFAGYAGAGDVSIDPGAYVAASSARLNNPFKLAIWPGGHVLIADTTNYSTRMIW
jgi:hypothetical protein